MSNRRSVGIACVVLLAPYLVYGRMAGLDHLVRFFPDDAFYCLLPAHNLARQGFATFDGVHATNGFHPLNFVLLAAIAPFVSRAAFIPTVFVIHISLVIAATCLMCRRAFRASPSLAIATTGLLTLPPFTLPILLSSGLEAAVVVSATIWLHRCWDDASRDRLQRTRTNLLLGVSLGLLVLARIDLALAWIPFLIAWARTFSRRTSPQRGGLRSFSAVWGVPAVIAGAYVATNVMTTGHVLPVSAWVKSLAVDWGRADWSPSAGHGPAGWLVVLAPLALSIAFLAVRALGRYPSDDALGRLVPLNVSNVIWYAYLALAVPWVFRWYLAFPYACALCTLPALAARAFAQVSARVSTVRLWQIAAAAMVVNLAATAAVLGWIGSRPNSVSSHLRQIAAELDTVAGKDDIAATTDAGIVGYFSSIRVINLDGLANDFDFATNYLNRGRLREYFAKERVSIYIARDKHLANGDAVLRGDYERAESALDPTLSLSKHRELFRHEIPGTFRVVAFRVGPE